MRRINCQRPAVRLSQQCRHSSARYAAEWGERRRSLWSLTSWEDLDLAAPSLASCQVREAPVRCYKLMRGHVSLGNGRPFLRSSQINIVKVSVVSSCCTLREKVCCFNSFNSCQSILHSHTSIRLVAALCRQLVHWVVSISLSHAYTTHSLSLKVAFTWGHYSRERIQHTYNACIWMPLFSIAHLHIFIVITFHDFSITSTHL